jgi:hypothetical protein
VAWVRFTWNAPRGGPPPPRGVACGLVATGAAPIASLSDGNARRGAPSERLPCHPRSSLFTTARSEPSGTEGHRLPGAHRGLRRASDRGMPVAGDRNLRGARRAAGTCSRELPPPTPCPGSCSGKLGGATPPMRSSVVDWAIALVGYCEASVACCSMNVRCRARSPWWRHRRTPAGGRKCTACWHPLRRAACPVVGEPVLGLGGGPGAVGTKGDDGRPRDLATSTSWERRASRRRGRGWLGPVTFPPETTRRCASSGCRPPLPEPLQRR